VNSNNHLNEVYSLFDRLHKELSPGFHLVDMFSDFFHIVNCKDIEAKSTHQKKLDEIFDNSFSNSNTILVISDASIKNNVATSISHVCNSQNIITKTIHHAMKITSTKTELFSTRCEINLAVQVPNVG